LAEARDLILRDWLVEAKRKREGESVHRPVGDPVAATEGLSNRVTKAKAR
jgi:hypothetical protein